MDPEASVSAVIFPHHPEAPLDIFLAGGSFSPTADKSVEAVQGDWIYDVADGRREGSPLLQGRRLRPLRRRRFSKEQTGETDGAREVRTLRRETSTRPATGCRASRTSTATSCSGGPSPREESGPVGASHEVSSKLQAVEPIVAEVRFFVERPPF